MVWVFVPCPRSQLILTLDKSFKSWGLIELWKLVDGGVYVDVYSALQCCGVFSFVFLVMRREAASRAVLEKMPNVTQEVKGTGYISVGICNTVELLIYRLLCSAMPGEDSGTGNVAEVNDGLQMGFGGCEEGVGQTDVQLRHRRILSV